MMIVGGSADWGVEFDSVLDCEGAVMKDQRFYMSVIENTKHKYTLNESKFV